ncbi:hypothetical protein QBC34DRAFT_398544 [Podospora aff. communis PSN243]|uniref:Extracellular membrane protein CFEM domain-containing protein n=1 Tax=Podospora aff. communis PSN243 TaxID=3040156 RepID=A0AAV9GYZ2_9PEZI|nr:hypothetical protein QBC34DRAFT_398544 [Podospora aff. communis PSN243]
MSLRRLAQKPLPSLTLLLAWTSTLIQPVEAAPKISTEILNFVPPCAQACFKSFILTNLESSVCGDTPSLACLCRQSGRTGHTIGEGAVACIAAESSRGSCSGRDASLQTQATSYNMCVGISGAAPKTHSTIVATLVVPTGTGGLSVPTPRPTNSASRPPSQDVTSVFTPTSAAPTASTSNSAGSTQGTIRPSDTSAAVVPETPAAAQQQPQLSSAQIVGIVLGCLAVVVFGILLVFLARCVRRRRFGGDPEAGFTKMRDSLSFGRRSQPTSPPDIQISKPLHSSPSDRAYQWQANPPRPQQTLAVQQPAGASVGLAISPRRTQQAASDVAAMRAAQRGTPTVVLSPPAPMASTAKVENVAAPKPALTLAIPPAMKTQRQRAAPNPRESIVTEFAEDGEGDSVPNTSNIWRPPPTDPQSATTYFFADKGGNWILRNKSDRKPAPREREPPVAATEVELPSPDDKTKAERAQGWFSPGAFPEPLRVPSRGTQQTKLGSPISFKDQQSQASASRRENRSSSIYSTYNAPVSMMPGPQNPLPPPDTYFAMIRDGRDLTNSRSSGSRRKSAARKASKRRSADSTTSIESAAAAGAPRSRMPYEDEALIEDEMQVDLSPVVESPRTPLTPGQSPVTYPRIRKRDAASPPVYDMQQGLSMFPVPGGQGRQGPGLMVPANPMGAGARRLNPPMFNPGMQRTGSPEVRQGPSMETIEQGQRYHHQQQQWQVGTGRTPSPRRGPYELAAEVQPARRTAPAQQSLQEQRRPSPAVQALQEQPQRRPSPAATNPSQPSRSLSRSPAESSSSLLAKRRGAEKAAALSLADQEARRNNKQKGWKKEEVEMPPITPGIRMMTPTRKGDDLFLDVRR